MLNNDYQPTPMITERAHQKYVEFLAQPEVTPISPVEVDVPNERRYHEPSEIIDHATVATPTPESSGHTDTLTVEEQMARQFEMLTDDELRAQIAGASRNIALIRATRQRQSEFDLAA